MSLLKTLITKKPIPQPVEVPVEPLIERKAKVEVTNGAEDIAPNHDPEHKNHAYRQELLKRLKARNAAAYDKIMSWD